MIDLHTHTFFSDGTMCPSELVQRAEEKGLLGIAITDHADASNLEFVLERLRPVVSELNAHHRINALAGVELTHVPRARIGALTARARDLGAQVVVVHGETIVEPVPRGTNLAAIEARVDVLAHPGLLTPEEARLAAEHGVLLELSSRAGHCLGNGRVAALARQAGARVVINSDTHASRDLIDERMARKVAAGAGLDESEIELAFANSERLLRGAMQRSLESSPGRAAISVEGAKPLTT
jgi:histidinol phosphatase-like PHP family hydrolase